MKAPIPFNLTETPLTKGSSLIEASAGTGKTYAITALFVRLIVEENLSVREILAVTYTEAATEELRHRVRQALVQASQAFASGTSDVLFLKALVARYGQQSAEMEARLHNALCDFDEAPIYTIHGFCQRTLRDRAFESGLLFDTELVTDPSEFLQEIADDFWRKHFYEAGPVLVNFALKNGFCPERFLSLLRTCTNYPQIEFLSQAKDRGLDSLSAELESRYQAARKVWFSEANAIRACFGSATKWGNTPYNDDESMAALFDQLDTCFSESDTAFEALACLGEFCAGRLQERKSKRSKNPVPVHRFFELCEQLCSAEQLWLAGSTESPRHPKVQKTALGADRYVPTLVEPDAVAACRAAAAGGYRVVGVELADGAVPLHELDLAGDVCLVVGHEDRGLTPAVLDACEAVAFLPMLGKIGSLNVATAAAIACYEVRRWSWKHTPGAAGPSAR